jgi:hypothetical protein
MASTGEFCRDADRWAIGLNMDQLLPLLAAFGLGSIVTALVQSALSNRSKRLDRSFAEKQTAYVGLLEAHHHAAVEGTDEAAKSVAYWQVRCDLVGSDAVCDPISKSRAEGQARTSGRSCFQGTGKRVHFRLDASDCI